MPFLSFSQTLFSVGAESALWINNGNTNFGIGPSVGLDLSLGYRSNISVAGNTGLAYYPESNGSLITIPLLAGIKYYFDRSQEGVYIAGQVGLQLTRISMDFLGSKLNTTTSNLGFTPKLGVILNDKMDLSAGCNLIIGDGNVSQYLSFNFSYIINN